MLKLILRALSGSFYFFILFLMIQVITSTSITGLREDGSDEGEWFNNWFYIYKLALGDYGDFQNQFWNNTRISKFRMIFVYFYFIFCTVLLTIILLNLLITILGEVYDNMKEHKKRHNYGNKLSVLLYPDSHFHAKELDEADDGTILNSVWFHIRFYFYMIFLNTILFRTYKGNELVFISTSTLESFDGNLYEESCGRAMNPSLKLEN